MTLGVKWSQANDSRTYDTMSFNSGCYDAIHHQGDPATNQDLYPVPGYGRYTV
jgi:hypothetical protein